MNFDFDAELKELGETARNFLAEACGPPAARHALEHDEQFDNETWHAIAEMGWLAASIPEEHGGLGFGHLAVCVLAAEMGRALAPLPFSSSVYLATEALLLFGSQEQKREWLPRVAAGNAIGTFALVEHAGYLDFDNFSTCARDKRLTGQKPVVADGSIADFAIVSAMDDTDAPALFLAPLVDNSVESSRQETIDPSRSHSNIRFDKHPAEKLPGSGRPNAIQHLVDRAAVMLAFEQLGVAEAALDMACAYAKERFAFGRAIGSFQAIKHKLADVYIANQLARSNCYYGAWALHSESAELSQAAAVSRLSAGEAAWQATKENIQTHGGMGFTWAMDCHLYYRRAGLLGLTLGGASQWKRRLIATLRSDDMAHEEFQNGF